MTRRMYTGKWHLGSYDNASTPLRRGFDTTYGYSNGEEDHWTHIVNGLYDLYNGTDYAIGPTVSGTHGTYLFAAAAANVVATASRPYFLYYALQNTHVPLEAPESYIDSEPCASIESDPNYPGSIRVVYCAMAAMADEAIHNVTQRIDPSKTLVVIAGDNGGLVSGGANNWPLRGQKAEPWEGGVRNHALLWGWGLDEWRQRSHIGPATYNMGLVHITDIHASFVALAGASNPYYIDGFDAFPAIRRNQPSPRHELLAMYDPCSSTSQDGACTDYTFAYIYRGFKLVRAGALNDTWYAPPGATDNDVDSTFTTLLWPAPYGDVRLDALASAQRDDTLHLYNLRYDPEERIDLVTSNASYEVRRLIRTIYNRFQFELRDEMPPCNIPNGSCYDDDPVGETTCDIGGFWRPWVSD